MSDIVETFRSYAHDKDNMPRMETEVVYVRVKHLRDAAAEIERLRAALWEIASHNADPRFFGAAHKIASATVGIARAALEDK